MKGYKTIAFNVLMAAITVLAAIYPEAVLPEAAQVEGVIEAVFAGIAGVITVGNMLLRAVTNTAVGQKEETNGNGFTE